MKARPQTVCSASVLATGLWAMGSRLLACPLCKETVREQTNASVDGYSVSTLLMLGILFGMLSLLIFYMARQAKGIDALKGTASQEAPAPRAAPPARSR